MADEESHSHSQQSGSQQSFPESQRTYVSSQRSSSSSQRSLHPLHPRSSQDHLLLAPPPLLPAVNRQLRHLPSGFAKLPLELHRRIITLALSPPDLSMPMKGLHSKEGTVLPQVCKLYASLTTPLLHSRVLLPTPEAAQRYLSTIVNNSILATYIRRLELQGTDWDVETVLRVLAAVGREGEIERVLAGEGWKGVKCWEMYCPAPRGQPAYPISLPVMLPRWAETITSLGLLLPPPHSPFLLRSLITLPHLKHLYLNAGSFGLSLPDTLDPLPPPDPSAPEPIETTTFYLHLLAHAKAHRIRVLLYLRRPTVELAEFLGRDASLRAILTLTSNTDNHLFRHVFEDMDSPSWRRKTAWEGWNEVLDRVPAPELAE